MRKFCEAFGFRNIEAPSTKAKRIQKKVSKLIKKPFRPSYPKSPRSKKTFAYKNKQPSKTLLTCLKCEQP